MKLTDLPWTHRRKILENLGLSHNSIKLSFVSNKPLELWAEVIKKGGEGIVLKDKTSPYLDKRSNYWLKVKNVLEKDLEFVRYTENSAGITISTKDNITCQVSGAQHYEVKKKLDEGIAVCSVRYLRETEDNRLYQISFMKLVEE